MWNNKKFINELLAKEWIDSNKHRYTTVLIYINNGCLVEYKKLRKVY